MTASRTSRRTVSDDTGHIPLSGELIAATDLVWVVIAPCGCVTEGLTAATVELPCVGTVPPNVLTRGDVRFLRTGEEARVYRHDGITALIERDRELGFTYSLMRRVDYDRTMGGATDSPAARCPHDPYLGIAVVHPPAGYRWATSDQFFGRRTYKRHLVREDLIDHHPPSGVGLCNAAATIDRLWHGGSWLIETVPCRACEQVALKIETRSHRVV